MLENYISKVKLPGDETTYDIRAHKTAGIYYAQVDSTSTSTNFTATIADLNIDAYYDGLTVLLYNGKVTSASGFTININGLGAKPSYSNMTLGNPVTPTDPTRDTTIFNINYAMLFVYNSTRVSGGCWICYCGYDANTNTIGYQLRSNNTTMPTTDKFYRYRLLFTSADHNHWVPANTSTSTNATAKRDTIQRPIDPFGEIVWYGTTTAIEANANVTAAQLWQEYYGSYTAIGYSFNRTGAAQTMTANRPIYIKCAPQSDGSAIIDADTPYVQALPNSEDGKIYIFLGRAHNDTNFEILMNHPVYYYKDGAIRLWSNAAQVGPELFEVTINTTTYAQLAAAINNGQIPYAEGYLYDGFDGSNYNFVGAFESNGYHRYSLNSTSGWTTDYCAFQAEGYNIIYWVTGNERWSDVYNLASINGNLPIYVDLTSNVLLYLRNIDSSYTMHFVGEDASNYYEITLAHDDTWSSVTTTPKPSIPTATSDLTNDGDDGTHPFLATDDVVSTYSSTGTAPVNGTAVAAALATIPSPMIFKGTVGNTSGSVTVTWASLLGSSYMLRTGYTYKVVEEPPAILSVAPDCKVGDIIICTSGTTGATATWAVVPSGDEPSGTVTNIATGSGLTGGPIDTTGTISHADTSSQASSTNSGRTYIQSVGLDDFGHVTSLSTATETVTDTNTTYTLSGGLSSHKFTSTLTAGGSGSGTSTAELTLAAGSNVSLTDDTTNKKITIAATDTTYTFANGTNSFTVTPSGGSAQTVTVTPSVNASSQLTGVVPLANGGTGIAAASGDTWYTSDALHPHFEVVWGDSIYIRYCGPMDGISSINSALIAPQFKQALASVVLVVDSKTGIVLFTGTILPDMMGDNLSYIYVLFPDAVYFMQTIVNGVSGQLIYDSQEESIYVPPASLQINQPYWYTSWRPTLYNDTYAGSIPANKTLATLSEANGIIDASIQDIAITSDQVTRNTTDATIATNDKLGIFDASDSNKLKSSSITFDTTETDTYLRRDGEWATPPGGGDSVWVESNDVAYYPDTTSPTMSIDSTNDVTTINGDVVLNSTDNTFASPQSLKFNLAGNKQFKFSSSGNGQNMDVGWDWSTGAGSGIGFRSKDHSNAGQFFIYARNTTSGYKALQGTPAGVLTWDGRTVVTGYNIGSTTQPVYIDGAGHPQLVTQMDTAKLMNPPIEISGIGDPTYRPLINNRRANHLAFLPASQIIIEQTTDGGTTWVDAGISDGAKINLFSETRASTVYLPLVNGQVSSLGGLRITFTPMNYAVPSGVAETDKYSYWRRPDAYDTTASYAVGDRVYVSTNNYAIYTCKTAIAAPAGTFNSTYWTASSNTQERYFSLQNMYFWLSVANTGIGIGVKYQVAKGNAPDTWVDIFDSDSYNTAMTGWSGGNCIKFANTAIGGSLAQTGNSWNCRLTFFPRTTSGGSDIASGLTGKPFIQEIRGFGDSWWTTINASSAYASIDHLYKWDYLKNATFPAKITVGSAPTADMDVATKKYVDDNAGGGGGSNEYILEAPATLYVGASLPINGTYQDFQDAVTAMQAGKKVYLKIRAEQPRGSLGSSSNYIYQLSSGYDSTGFNFCWWDYFSSSPQLVRVTCSQIGSSIFWSIGADALTPASGVSF